MRFVGALISALIALGLAYLLNNPINLGGKNIPALGKLLNPFTGYLNNTISDTGKFSKNVDLPELSSTVEVVFDEKFVPHIFADNLKDAVTVQGYLTAQHRLWQMEFITHASGGRVSEILGKGKDDAYLNFDKMQRRMGMLYSAERSLELWKKESSAYYLLEAYAEGVNAFINNLKPEDYPIEYKLMGYEPEAWSPLKTSLLLKYMSNALCGKSEDVLKNNTRTHLGDKMFNELFPEYFDRQSPIIPTKQWDFQHEDSVEVENAFIDKYFLPNPEPQPSKHLGSNNWAISAEKTANGKPLLSNDPHLTLNLPSIWYELQIHTPETNVYGVSLPGSPGIIIGFNEDVSWGVTNVSWDVKDWFSIQFEDKSKEKYLFEGKYESVEKRIESFKLPNGEVLKDTVLYTRWGPVVYEDPNHPYGGMALKWLAHIPANDIEVFHDLNKAKNYNDYRKALKNYICPAQNIVFASKENDIALTVSGKLPKRKNQQGRFVQDGSKASSDWNGYIPFEHNPHTKNPEQGFIGSANQHSVHPDYPYYYTGYFEEYRGRHLNKQLNKMNDITYKDLMELQLDNYSVKAEDYVPVLVKLLDERKLNEAEKEALTKIKRWNYKFDADLIAPSIFEFWCAELTNLVWEDDIPEGSVNGLHSRIPSKEVTMIWPEENTLRELLEHKPQHFFFDDKRTEELENASDMVNKAFSNAVNKINNEKKKNWRNVQHTSVNHIAKIDAFSRKNRNVGGHGSALNANTSLEGPSWRMVVELGDEVKAWGVYPGGQSGNPASKYYDSMLDKWTKGEYYELFFMKNKEDKRMPSVFTQKFD